MLQMTAPRQLLNLKKNPLGMLTSLTKYGYLPVRLQFEAAASWNLSFSGGSNIATIKVTSAECLGGRTNRPNVYFLYSL